MKLTESEGKTILQSAGITIPEFFVLKQGDSIPNDLVFPVIAKAQTLSGKRGKAGLVKEAADLDELQHALDQIWKGNYAKRPFSYILIEPKLQIAKEFYISITYSQESKSPVLIMSQFGGMDIEVVSKRQPESIYTMSIDMLTDIQDQDIVPFVSRLNVKEVVEKQFIDLIQALYKLFKDSDAELVEINPLVLTAENELIAADCKMSLDDASLYRHEFAFEQRSGERPLTEKEEAARAIDARSHRGVVGRSYLELDGDIGFMSSGGGASITCLDALLSYGGRPANFVEYSGNPEREDVKDLTKIVLSQDIKALWVVGPTANFTDIYQTIGGILDALKEVKPDYPILIRRAGPRDNEAKDLVEQVKNEFGLQITFYGEEVSMTESAQLLMEQL